MSFQVSREDFEALDASWNYLLSVVARPTIFLTPLWHRIWWQHLGDGELYLLSLRHSGKVVGIAPLLRNQGHLRFLGGQDVVDYHDLILEPGGEGPALGALLDFLGQQEWESLEMTSLPEHSVTLDLLPGLARARGFLVEQTAEDVCPRLELPATWEGYQTSLSKKDRHELRRKLRRLYSPSTLLSDSSPTPKGRGIMSVRLLKESKAMSDSDLVGESPDGIGIPPRDAERTRKREHVGVSRLCPPIHRGASGGEADRTGHGDVNHYVVTDPEGVAQGMDDFFRLLRASREVKAEFLTPRREAFMRAMAIALAKAGHLRLFFLEVSGTRVATALCFYYGGGVSLYNSGYDPAYSSLSVGLLLKALSLREAIERGAIFFDFLRGAEPYKYHLGGKDYRLWQLTIHRPSVLPS